MSNHKLTIVFYVNGMAFNGDSLKEHSLGGSETAGLCMAREMAALGHDVVVFSNCDKPGKYDGVKYRNLAEFPSYTVFSDIDVLIAQRVPQVFSNPTKSKLNILWQHDLGLKRARKDFRGSLWNVDEVMGLSDFHIDQMAEVYEVPKELFWKTRNGIDPIQFKKGYDRKPKRLIYTARPERGMDILLFDIMPKIWEKDPEVELFLAGYDNTVPQMKPFYDSLHAKIAEHKEAGFKVEWLGALTKKELYEHYQRATLYVYPTEFEEISCITAMECMACGLPMIYNPVAALPETVPMECGVRLEITDDKDEQMNSRNPKYQEHFANGVVKAINSPKVMDALRISGLKHAKSLLWSDLAREWETHFTELIQAKSKNKEALAEQFYRNEDIMALKALNLPVWNKRVADEYRFIDDPELNELMYIEQGRHFKEKVEAKDFVLELQPYTRVAEAIGIMKKLKGLGNTSGRRILDYGGGIGNEAIQFVNELDCEVVSVNISPDEQEVGRKLAEKYCAHPEKIIWSIGNHPKRTNIGDFDYGCVFAGEILEHMADPTAFINELESVCINGGTIIFTVPFGPWGDTDNETDYRGHLWNFEKPDLRDLFGKKKDFSLRMVGGGVNTKNKQTVGWNIISYTKDGTPTGTIDMERKLSIQVPRQTISACMMIGVKQEGLLYRCLDSIKDIVSELIVLDTGMTDKCREVLKHYDVRIVENAPSPLDVGFDEVRNLSIAEAKGDWVLWIDSDEELLNAVAIFKYLRSNHYRGYSIKQHHFSAQPPNAFKADLPVRLFRNGLGIKFFGHVHEHPELELNEGIGMSTILSDVDIAHDGYLTEDIRRERFTRNYELLCKDREKNPERMLGKFLIMRDKMHLARYTLEKTNGQMTPEIIKFAEEVVEDYKADFLGKDTLMSGDGLVYYSEALAILGRGMEYAVSFDVKPKDAQLSEPVRARFESREDFLAYMSGKLKSLAEPFEGRYV